MLTTAGRTGRGAGMIVAVAIAAVAIAGLAAAPDADVVPWAAHAQSTPTTVQVGALLSTNNSDFADNERRIVLVKAVEDFNDAYDDIDLDLNVTEFVRNATDVTTAEPSALRMAYDGGTGPRFYIGPTTSQGITNINNTDDTRALLENDVLLISPSSEAPQLAADDNIFRLAFNVARQGDMLVDEMKASGIKSYIMVARNDAWGQQIAASVVKKAGQEDLAKVGEPILFNIDASAADWNIIRDSIAGNASTVPAGEDRIGVFFFGYDDDYSNMTAAANGSTPIRDNTAWFVPSTVGVNTMSRIVDDAMRSFSIAVGLTALSQDVADSKAKRDINELLFSDRSQNATFYEYSSYDSVFVLGNAMRMAMAAGEDANNVAMVKKYIAAAAMNYTGAALGDALLLDGNGDLRAPDTFTVHKLDVDGEWSDGSPVGSTVTRVGALLAIDNDDYTDNNARDVLLEAAADYNAAAGTGSLVKLITYDITDPTNSSKYVANDTLTRSHAGGAGPSAYIGPSLSSNVELVLPYATENNILLLGYASESESLSMPGDNLFRMAVSTDRHGKFMAEVMRDAGVESVVTVVRGDSWGMSLNKSIADALAPNGLSLAGSVMFAEGNSDWDSTLAALSTAIAGADGRAGVAFVGTEGEQNSLAPAALADSDASGVQWFVTPTGFYSNLTAAGDFAKAVNLTAIVIDVEDNAKKSALDDRVAGELNFYDYAAYDSLFILGNTIAAVVESGKTTGIMADDLRPLVPAQADAYDGVLGDIALNSNGDLGSPDRFAVYQIDRTSGEWTKTNATKSTPVVRIGALLAIDHEVYPDNLARDALRQAAADFNAMGDGDRPFYVSLTTYDITDPTNSSQYVERDALMRAYDDGNGPSAYIGPSLSSNVKDVIDYAAEKNILLLGYASESEELSIPGDNLFRMAVSADRHGKFMAEIMKDAGVQSVVTVVRGDSWGMSLNKSIADALAPNGLSLAGSVMFAEGNSDWDSTLADVSAAIAGDNGMTGVAFVGVRSEQDGLAAAASGNAAIRAVPWFVTPSGYYTDMSASTRDFARAVNLTAIVNDVADNAKKSALDEVVSGSPTFYEYAAYDSLFILGNTMAAVVESGKTTGIMADDLRPLVPAQADAYDGVLGDIALNSNGDLGSPDRFAVWKVDSTSGMWMDTGVSKSTPVVRIGALLAIDNTDYADNNARDALRQASADFNAAGGDRPFYVSLTTYDITDPTNSGKYVARDALMRAHNNGAGPSIYIGPSLSSNIEAVMPYVAGNDLLLLGYASESESLSIPGDNLFRTAISTARHGHFMAEVMADAGVKSVVTVARNDSWGRSLDASITEALAPNGLRMAGAVKFAPATSNWTSTIDEITSAIAAGGGNAGVAFVGVRSEQDGLAAAASGSMAATGVPWFVTPSGYYTDMSASTRDFARAVDMTAIVLDVEDNAMKSALDDKVAGDLNFYDYAAYDSLFILGNSVAAASSDTGRAVSALNATDLRPVIPAQADMYEGVLGDIALNSKGDLRSPDRFAVWQVDGTSGMWTNTGVTKSTPVVDVGAIVILESDRFDDSPRLAAARIAVDEYNTAAEDGGALYLNLRVVKTSLSPGSATTTSPVAHEAVMAASSGEDGIKYYVGPSTSGNSKRVLEYANDNGLTLISPSSTAPSLAIEDDALFRLVPNDSQQGKVLADIVHNQQGALLAALINQTGHEHVVMVVRNDTWGQGLDASTSGRLGVHDVDITRIVHEESDADWSQTAMDISAEIGRVRTATPNDPIAVLHIGFPGDFVSLAAQASDYPNMTTVPWFGTDGVAGTAPLVTNATARQFADDVNLTATKFDVVSNDRFNQLTAKLESQGVAVRTTYEYSAYDSVFVLGRAIEAAISAKNATAYTGADVRSSVRAAAADYEGALGDIELNKAGDLRTPNSYAAWAVENGSWKKVATHPSTPVFDIGALLMLDNNPIYTDDLEKDAMDVAVDEFNTEHELVGDFYISLAVQRISIAPNTGSPDPDALAGLMNAYANGDGPSLYVGPSTSGNSERVLDYANANDIVLISHSSTAPKLAIPGDNLFRMVAPDNRQGGILADLISVERGVTDLVMAVRGDTWGRGVDETTTAGLVDGTAVTRVMFAESEGDWPSVAANLGAAIDGASASAAAKQQGKAAVLFIGFDGDFNSVASQGSSVPSLSSVEWFGPDGVGNSQAVIANATSLAFATQVNMTTVIFSVIDNPVKSLLDPTAVYGPSAYDSVYIMGNAIKAAYAGSGSVPPALDVKALIPAVATNYTGALGNVALDANGDLLSPNTYGIYMINAATNMWTLDRIHPMLCGISLASSTIEFGDVNIGQASAPAEQTVRNAGRVALSMVSITATPWMGGSGAAVLDAGATELALATAPSTWMPLSVDAPTDIPMPRLAEPTTIMFRLNAAGASSSDAGSAEQTVTYTVTCEGS